MNSPAFRSDQAATSPQSRAVEELALQPPEQDPASEVVGTAAF